MSEINELGALPVGDGLPMNGAEVFPSSPPSVGIPSAEPKSFWFTRKEVAAVMARWAIQQSPYLIPDGLPEAVREMRDFLPNHAGDMFKANYFELTMLVGHFCHYCPTVLAWNSPRSGHTASVVFSSRYDGPCPDDDFIDLDALTRNIVRSLLADQDDWEGPASGIAAGTDETLQAAQPKATARAVGIARMEAPMSNNTQTQELRALLAKVNKRIEMWDDEEDREDWWSWQRDIAEAFGAFTHSLDHIERLEADEWQPIESAPKDRWILAAELEHPDVQYSAYAARWHSDGYWMANCGQYVTQAPQPTHWRPLPAPPARLALEQQQ